MNAALIYLIVTMGSSNVVSYKGYGGVSVTATPSYEVCLLLKDLVLQQLKDTPNIDIDDVKVTCKTVKVEKL